MKLIKAVEPPCPCTAKLWDFYQDSPDSCCWGVNTEVECDCGQVYILLDSQRDGKFWAKKSRITVLV